MSTCFSTSPLFLTSRSRQSPAMISLCSSPLRPLPSFLVHSHLALELFPDRFPLVQFPETLPQCTSADVLLQKDPPADSPTDPRGFPWCWLGWRVQAHLRPIPAHSKHPRQTGLATPELICTFFFPAEHFCLKLPSVRVSDGLPNK